MGGGAVLILTGRASEVIDEVSAELNAAIIQLIEAALRFIHGLLPWLAFLLGVIGVVVYTFDRFHGMRMLFGTLILVILWLALPIIAGW